MSRIAIVHPSDLGRKGGAECVALHIIEALEGSHDLTLFTTTEPNFADLNEYFHTDVSDIKVEVPKELVGKLIKSISNGLGISLHETHNSLVRRKGRADSGQFDLMISSKNEINFNRQNAIQYVHFPSQRFTELLLSNKLPQEVPEEAMPSTKGGAIKKFLFEVTSQISGYSAPDISGQKFVANSKWTAEIISKLYDVQPAVIHPPVATEAFNHVPWSDRENGFVSVGNVSQTKNIHKNIQIIRMLRERGHAVHYHIVGELKPDAYGRRIRSKADDSDYVQIEGRCSRDCLINIICNHKYGINGHRHEHFGIAVAEMVTGGMIPFVPNGGGQREILGGLDDLMFDSTEEAVQKIERLLDSASLQATVKQELPEPERTFGKQRFHSEFSNFVDKTLLASEVQSG